MPTCWGKNNNSSVLVQLERDGLSVPWGFRLSGGYDVDQPLIVTKVKAGSASDGFLRPKDVILKIGVYDAADISHNDALEMFKNAGARISVVVQRENTSSMWIDRNRLPSSMSAEKQIIRNNLSRFVPVLIDVAKTNTNTYKNVGSDNYNDSSNSYLDAAASYTNCGSSTISEMSWNESYECSKLQSTGTEYNKSPCNINAPSFANSKTLRFTKNTGRLTPLKKTVHYDPTQSETYKEITKYDNQFGNINSCSPSNQPVLNDPVVPRVFSPVPLSKKYGLNEFGVPVVRFTREPSLRQSNSFKRLMNMVSAD